MAAEGKVKRIGAEKKTRCTVVGFEDGEEHMQGPETSPEELRVTPAESQQKPETSVLRLQGAGFCQHNLNDLGSGSFPTVSR